jgi:hypothetical protein
MTVVQGTLKHELRHFTVALFIVALFIVVLTGCSSLPPQDEEPPMSLDAIAETYVKLVLAVGVHDGGYVDAYYGPESWQQETTAAARPLDEIRAAASASLNVLSVPAQGDDELTRLRHSFLQRQLAALVARIDFLTGKRLSFDEESEALYNAVAPAYTDEQFQRALTDLDHFLTEQEITEGSLVERYDAFRGDFVIPPERLDEVFRTAINACRERTAAHVELPAGESFTVEYVKDKSWSAYNWYQGNLTSIIQVNTDLPVYIDRAVDLACHEGYPGHHVYNMLLESHLVRERGWVEFQVYPLFSPQSLIAEGSANFGIEMAFPQGERLAFERDVLFPLAGLDPALAESYEAVRELMEQLRYADNEAARRYLDGQVDRETTIRWLASHAALTEARAEQRVAFISQYRSYVINYTLGLDLVRGYIDARADVAAPPEERWHEFEQLLSSPRLPADLR